MSGEAVGHHTSPGLDRDDLGLPAGLLRPIVRWGEPIMHRRLAPVTAFDDDLAQLVADMFVTMDAADGVGLAANQVGVDLALFVFDARGAGDGDEAYGVVCNPELTIPGDGVDGAERVDGADAAEYQQMITDSEGCLSLPGAFVPCKRPLLASVTGVDHTGSPVQLSGSGLLARCLQHETDHVRGVVFADHVPSRLRRKLQKQAERFAPEFPAAWPVEPRIEPED